MKHWVAYLDGVVDGLLVAPDEGAAVGSLRQACLGQTPTPIVTVRLVAEAPGEDVIRGLAIALLAMQSLAQAAMLAGIPKRGRN